MAFCLKSSCLSSDTSIINQLDLDDEAKECLLNHIARRLSPQKVKVRADIEVTCYTYEGVDAVKEALHAGLNKSTDEVTVKVRNSHQLMISMFAELKQRYRFHLYH